MIKVEITVEAEPSGVVMPRRSEVHRFNDSFRSATGNLEAGRDFFNKVVANVGLLKQGIQKSDDSRT